MSNCSAQGKLDINDATLDELMTLKRDVEKQKRKPLSIIEKRSGRFASFDDLAKVFGIGMKLIEQNKDQLLSTNYR